MLKSLVSVTWLIKLIPVSDGRVNWKRASLLESFFGGPLQAKNNVEKMVIMMRLEGR